MKSSFLYKRKRSYKIVRRKKAGETSFAKM